MGKGDIVDFGLHPCVNLCGKYFALHFQLNGTPEERRLSWSVTSFRQDSMCMEDLVFIA